MELGHGHCQCVSQCPPPHFPLDRQQIVRPPDAHGGREATYGALPRAPSKVALGKSVDPRKKVILADLLPVDIRMDLGANNII